MARGYDYAVIPRMDLLNFKRTRNAENSSVFPRDKNGRGALVAGLTLYNYHRRGGEQCCEEPRMTLR